MALQKIALGLAVALGLTRTDLFVGALELWSLDHKDTSLTFGDKDETFEVIFEKTEGKYANSSVLNYNCKTPADGNVIRVANDAVTDPNAGKDTYTVTVEVNKTAILTLSELWKGNGGTSTCKGNITMCVRADVWLEGGSTSANFREVRVNMMVDICDNVFELAGNVTADTVGIVTDDVANNYGVNFFQCNDTYANVGKKYLAQNQQLQVCLESNSTDTKISNFDLTVYQDQMDDTEVIQQGASAPAEVATLSEIAELVSYTQPSSIKGWMTKFQMLSKFFDTDKYAGGVLPPVTINGTAVLVFDNETRRHLLLRNEPLPLIQFRREQADEEVEHGSNNDQDHRHNLQEEPNLVAEEQQVGVSLEIPLVALPDMHDQYFIGQHKDAGRDGMPDEVLEPYSSSGGGPAILLLPGGSSSLAAVATFLAVLASAFFHS